MKKRERAEDIPVDWPKPMEYARKLYSLLAGLDNRKADETHRQILPNSWGSPFVVWTTMVSNHLRSPHFGS